MVLALCMLDNEGYRYAFRILNAYVFSMATVVVQMHLNVMCIHVLSVLLYLCVWTLIFARRLLLYYCLIIP